MADVSVREARSGESGEIARIQVETWRHGYRTILPAPVLDALDAAGAGEAWAAAIEAPPTPRHRLLVALEQQWLVGFVAVVPADADEPETEGVAAAVVGPLLVEPRWTRRGHGSRLMAAAVDHARGDGMTRALCWVPEADAATREFLAAGGWEPDGLARTLDTGAGELRELRFHVAL